MHLTSGIRVVLTLFFALSVGCTETKQDFCKHLSLEEAQAFDPTISNTEMRQTKRILYCVYKNDTSDRLFVSVDRAMKYSPKDFLKVLAKNSPDEYEEIVSLSSAGIDSAALFLGNVDELQLDFLISQNSEYSVTIRAREVTSTSSGKIDKLQSIATKVLSRI